MYNFSKSGSLGTSAISRCFTREETKIWVWVDIFYEIYFFAIFNAVTSSVT